MMARAFPFGPLLWRHRSTLAALLLAGASLAAQATNYTFPGSMPAGCTGSSGSYSCGSVSLGYNDTITIASPKPATITINGNFSTDTSSINAAGTAADLTLNITGTLSLGYNPTIKANITAGTVADPGGQGNITGNLTATSGNLTLGFKTNVSGNVSNTGGGSLTLGQSANYGGNVSSTSGAITMGQTAQISGSVSSTSGAITVAQSAHVFGSVSSTSGAVAMNFASTLDGNITTSGAVTVAQNALVSGNIQGGTGLVDLQFGATVNGTITTSSGAVSVAQNAQAKSCVRSTGSASITLGYQARVNSVCCGGACGNSCVVNNSTFSMPPACAASPSAVDHYELSLPTTAVSCLPVTATVTACADSSSPCTNAYTGGNGKTVGLTANNGGVLGSGTLVLNASGTASTTLSYAGATDGTVVAVSFGATQQSATNPSKCCPNGINCSVATSCSATFNTAGLVMSASIGGAALSPFPTQEAGTPATYYLRAVKTNNGTKACEAAITGIQHIDWAMQCNNPNLCSAGPPSPSGRTLMSVISASSASQPHPLNGNPIVAYPATTQVDLNFDANGNALFSLNYADVGQVTLYASRAAGNGLATAVAGNSGVFVVKPGALELSNIKCSSLTATTCAPERNTAGDPNNPAATTANGAAFIQAGQNFSVTVTAKVKDKSAPTPNFGKESPAQTVTLLASDVRLAPGNTVTLGNPTPFSFNGGVATGAFTWDDVGILSLTPSASYFSNGVTGTTVSNVGRFIPNHFDTVVTPACGAGTPFTYSGQPFKTQVIARNASGGTTASYDTSFGLSRQVTLTNAGSATNLTANSVPAANFSSGSLLATTPALPVYTFATKTTVPGTITLRATDADLISSQGHTEGTTQVRSGRARLANAYGSDLLDLPVLFRTEYWVSASSRWQLNSADTCTDATLTKAAVAPVDITAKACVIEPGNNSGMGCAATPVQANRSYLEAGVTGTDSSGASGFAGNFNLWLRAPGAGTTGSVDITATVPSWLQFNWTGTVANPKGRASFGAFKSPLIFLRENY